jgi:hypothetical protein
MFKIWPWTRFERDADTIESQRGLMAIKEEIAASNANRIARLQTELNVERARAASVSDRLRGVAAALRCRLLAIETAFGEIADCDTTNASHTVKKMAAMARKQTGLQQIAVPLESLAVSAAAKKD